LVFVQLIEHLKNNALIWQGNQTEQVGASCSSGYPLLDNTLNGGFPCQGIIEIRSTLGIGELRLMLPYLKARASEGLLVFIAPPATLCAQSLVAKGFNLADILILEAKSEESLWCAEQCLKSGCCASVILWHQDVEIHQVRRLTLACEQGDASLVLYRSGQVNCLSLPLRLSLTLTAHESGLLVKVNKRRAGGPTSPFVVNMAHIWPEFSSSVLPKNVISLSDFKRQAV